MELTEIAVERTTAATDLILAIMAFIIALHIHRIGKNRDQIKSIIWVCVFVSMMLASAFGAVVHGFVMSLEINRILWQPIVLFLGMTVSLFAIGVVYDLRGFRISKITVSAFITMGIIFYLVTLFFLDLFFVFVVYEVIVMIFSLTVYVVLAVRKELAGSGLMAAGVVVSLAASVIQVLGPNWLHFMWEFDHNGIFHTMQMFALIFFVLGLREDFLSRTT